jgi:hypothetical protein
MMGTYSHLLVLKGQSLYHMHTSCYEEQRLSVFSLDGLPPTFFAERNYIWVGYVNHVDTVGNR